MATKQNDVAAAIVTLKRPADMTSKGAKRIAAWLRQQAEYLEDPSIRKELADTFRARYMVAR